VESNAFQEFWRFLLALWQEWKALLTGGTLIAVIALWQFLGGPPLLSAINWLIVGATFILASFLSWRKQFRSVNAQQATIAALEKALVRKRPDVGYKEEQVRKWLESFTQEEVKFIQWLLHHGESDESEFRRSAVHVGVSGSALNKGLTTGLVLSSPRGTGTSYSINENYLDALTAILHSEDAAPPLSN
jgi:hypothetical protein